MRIFLAVVGIFVAGCSDVTAPTPQATLGPALGEGPAGSQQALFDAYPAFLFAAATAECSQPGQSVESSGANDVRCESLPSVETAAALILRFDGTFEDLPRFVLSFSGRPLADGYLVTADNFIRVPQRGGVQQIIRFPDSDGFAQITRILTATGGVPL